MPPTNNLDIDFDADLAEIEADITDSIRHTVSGTAHDYSATVEPVPAGVQILTEVGALEDISFRVLVRTSLLDANGAGGRISAGDIVEYPGGGTGKELRVELPQADEIASAQLLFLREKTF